MLEITRRWDGYFHKNINSISDEGVEQLRDIANECLARIFGQDTVELRDKLRVLSINCQNILDEIECE